MGSEMIRVGAAASSFFFRLENIFTERARLNPVDYSLMYVENAEAGTFRVWSVSSTIDAAHRLASCSERSCDDATRETTATLKEREGAFQFRVSSKKFERIRRAKNFSPKLTSHVLSTSPAPTRRPHRAKSGAERL